MARHCTSALQASEAERRALRAKYIAMGERLEVRRAQINRKPEPLDL